MNDNEYRCKKHGTTWRYSEQFGVCIEDNPRTKNNDIEIKFPSPCNKSNTRRRPDLDRDLSEMLGMGR